MNGLVGNPMVPGVAFAKASASASVLIRFPFEAEEHGVLHGVVLESDLDWCRVRVDGHVAGNVNPRIELLCIAPAGGSHRMEANIMGSSGPAECPTLDLRIVGPPQRIQPRQTYRASVAGLGLDAHVSGLGVARLLDVSAEGMAVLARHALQKGRAVTAKLEFAGQRLIGTLIARHIVPRDRGRFRVGLEAKADDGVLRRALRDMTMAVQREQLRRLAALRTDAPLPPGGAAHPGRSSGAGEMHALEDWTRPDEHRAHPRLPWKSELVIELDEGGPVRLLRVETIDICRGGFGCISRAYLHVGSKVAATLPIREEGMRVIGQVRYCQVAGDFGHRVGVQFTEARIASVAREGAETREISPAT